MAAPIESPTHAMHVALPGPAVACSRRLITAIKAELPRGLADLSQLVRRRYPRFDDEFDALAKLLAVDVESLVLANISYDLTLSLGCSTLAIATEDGPMIARNMDWWPEDLLAQASCLMTFGPPPPINYWLAGWVGAVGAVTGMSQRGFAIALNAVSCEEPGSLDGYPVLLFLRSVLEDANSFDQALTMLRDTQLASPALFTLIGNDNQQRVVVERTPRAHALRWPAGSQPLVATNDYRLLQDAGSAQADNELHASACSRYDRAIGLAGDLSSAPCDDDLLAILTDDAVQMQITAQHVLMRPRQHLIRVWSPAHLHG